MIEKNSEKLAKDLEIGLADFIPLLKRRQLINSDISVTDFRKYFKCNFQREVDQIIKWLEGGKNRFLWSFSDCSYPSFLGVERRIPYFMMCEGKIPSGNTPKACVIGTRRCNYKGVQEAFRLSLELTANGISVLSGLAEGCDQSALYGAIRANEEGFNTACYAVLGCGLNVSYPYGTDRIKKKIIETGGCIISRFSPDMPPLRHNFPSRNMILSALSDICILVQCPVKSGAMITAEFALDMGKELFISTSGLDNGVTCSGTRKLYESGCSIFETDFEFKKKAVNSNSGIRYGNTYYQIL